jgi:hexosaminidase
MKLLPQLSFIVLVVLLISCSEKEKASSEAKQAPFDLIPKARVVETGDDALTISEPVTYTEGATKSGSKVFFSIVSDPELGDEGYEINVTTESITVSANKPAGLFYGTQTLNQIGVKNSDGIEYAVGKIRDYPTFGWRGSMLDVARHFFSVEDVKDYIDKIAYYKMNVLHLHLSDDQGWRIEIKSWPKLTEVGGQTQVGGGGGGFYTQEQFKDIVAYAAARFITIIPEIDMPSHINAALAAYPELHCNGVGKKPELYEGVEVGFSTLCRADGEIEAYTLKFVNDIVREISAMSPSPYFHIGGDEAHVTKKEDYIAFINSFKKIVEANGKHMIGWEEISQANIGAGDIAQHWHSKEMASAAAQKGAKIIMSPSTKVYLDMKYDSTIKNIGYDWAALIEVDDSYMWKVEEMIPGVNLDNVAGVEAPLWGETLKTMDDIEFLLFPRLPGIAEIGWSAQDRNWDEYKVRLGKHGKKMEEMNINFYRSPKVPWVTQ